jgi:hypothetical protein
MTSRIDLLSRRDGTDVIVVVRSRVVLDAIALIWRSLYRLAVPRRELLSRKHPLDLDLECLLVICGLYGQRMVDEHTGTLHQKHRIPSIARDNSRMLVIKR